MSSVSLQTFVLHGGGCSSRKWSFSRSKRCLPSLNPLFLIAFAKRKQNEKSDPEFDPRFYSCLSEFRCSVLMPATRSTNSSLSFRYSSQNFMFTFHSAHLWIYVLFINHRNNIKRTKNYEASLHVVFCPCCLLSPWSSDTPKLFPLSESEKQQINRHRI